MPIYFCNLTDNGRVFPDTAGSELNNVEAAREHALSILGERARAELPDGDHHIFVVDVVGHDGLPVLTANLSLIVTYPKMATGLRATRIPVVGG